VSGTACQDCRNAAVVESYCIEHAEQALRRLRVGLERTTTRWQRAEDAVTTLRAALASVPVPTATRPDPESL
jgi:hypothetical protein